MATTGPAAAGVSSGHRPWALNEPECPPPPNREAQLGALLRHGASMISDGIVQDHHCMERVTPNPAPVYPELRRLAAAYLRDERPGHTLQPTALVNEAVLRLLSSGEAEGMEARALIR